MMTVLLLLVHWHYKIRSQSEEVCDIACLQLGQCIDHGWRDHGYWRFAETRVKPRRQMQRRFIGEAIAAGELNRGTDTELLIDALNGPLFFDGCRGMFL